MTVNGNLSGATAALSRTVIVAPDRSLLLCVFASGSDVTSQGNRITRSRHIAPSPSVKYWPYVDAAVAGEPDGSVIVASSSPTIDLGSGPLLQGFQQPDGASRAFVLARLAP